MQWKFMFRFFYVFEFGNGKINSSGINANTDDFCPGDLISFASFLGLIFLCRFFIKIGLQLSL